MYGVEWLIALGIAGMLVGTAIGYALSRRSSSGAAKTRELETALAEARQELQDYRQEVVAQFSDTARKFQTLNDSYTDLHEQLARSSSVLCGDISGPLLEAPAGHQDLIPQEVRDREAARRSDGETAEDVAPVDQTTHEAAPASAADAPTAEPASPDDLGPADGEPRPERPQPARSETGP